MCWKTHINTKLHHPLDPENEVDVSGIALVGIFVGAILALAGISGNHPVLAAMAEFCRMQSSLTPNQTLGIGVLCLTASAVAYAWDIRSRANRSRWWLRHSRMHDSMLFAATLAAFVTGAMVASALAHEPTRWRYAAGLTLGCGVILATWSANVVTATLLFFGTRIEPAVAWVVASVPYALVIVNMWIRRGRTPRYAPGPDDDPVLRRYLAEKLRRRRLRRQAEDTESATDDPACS
jgi:hypothetical protein